MPDDSQIPPPSHRLGDWGSTGQWLLILGLSIAFVVLFELVHLPAAPFLGPMVAGIIAGTNGATVRLHPYAFNGAQMATGSLIATSVSIQIVWVILANGMLLLGVVAATVAASMAMGWLISRWNILPGSTGVWGSTPGAAAAMVVMAQAFGADARLVAFMQYLRVIAVSIAAALVARFWVAGAVEAGPVDWFPPLEPVALAATLATICLGGYLGMLARMPAAFLLGSAFFCMIMHIAFDVPIKLPPWLLAISYAAMGWTVGLHFTRHILLHAVRALPQVIGSILALMAFCGGLAWLLVSQLGIDPLTAYLATTPGGMDSVAIIALAAGPSVDLSFVMAMQLARMLFILAFGPLIARFVARTVRG